MISKKTKKLKPLVNIRNKTQRLSNAYNLWSLFTSLAKHPEFVFWNMWKMKKCIIAKSHEIAAKFDNYHPHPKEMNQKTTKLQKFFYLPPNSTLNLHPRNQINGWSKVSKYDIAWEQILKFITALGNNQSIPKINLLEDLSEISIA